MSERIEKMRSRSAPQVVVIKPIPFTMLNLFSRRRRIYSREGYRTPYGKTYRPYILYTCACAHSLFERDHIFNVVGRNRQVLGVICMPHRWRSGAMGCGVRHAGCGLCAPAARGRGRESGERQGHRAERQHRRWYCTALWESR